MRRKSFASVLLVLFLSSSSAFAAVNREEGRAERLRDRERDQPFMAKVVRVIKRVVGQSYLIGDPRP